MIDMEVKAEGVIESLFNQGFREGRKSILYELLGNHSMVEVAEFLGISLSELNDMIK